MRGRGVGPLVCIVLAVACEQPEPRVLAPDPAFDESVSAAGESILDPGQVFGGGQAVARVASLLASTTVVDIRTAPGPDGIAGTQDDIVFDASFTPRYQRTDGTISVNWASPTGLEWATRGVVFQPISGAVALTIGANGCLGSQLPAPAPVYPNWDGGVGIDFVGPNGVPAMVSRVAVNVAGIASRLEAFDLAGNLLGSESADSYTDYLSVTAPGIAQARANGQFWCIATFLEYDDLVASVAGIVSQIGRLVASGDVDPGVAQSLLAMLDAADAALARGQNAAAVNVLRALIAHVTAQDGKHVSASAATALIAWFQGLAASL